MKSSNNIPHSLRHSGQFLPMSQHQGEQCCYCTQGWKDFSKVTQKSKRGTGESTLPLPLGKGPPFLLGTAHCSLTLWGFFLCLTLPSQFYKYKTLCTQFIFEMNAFIFHPQCNMCMCIRTMLPWNSENSCRGHPMFWLAQNNPRCFLHFFLKKETRLGSASGWDTFRERGFVFQWQPLNKCQHWAVTVQVHSDAAPASAINLQTGFTLK